MNLDRYQLVPELGVLLQALTPLSAMHQVAYATACSERLYPGFARHARTLAAGDALQPLLQRLWAHVLGNPLSPGEARRDRQVLMELEIGDDSLDSHADAVAALSAFHAALQARETPSPHFAVTAGQAVLNDADSHAQAAIDASSPRLITRFTPELQAQIDAHPIMARARAFLADTLYLLGNSSISPALIATIKRRAGAA